jgi:hypothetical protein
MATRRLRTKLPREKIITTFAADRIPLIIKRRYGKSLAFQILMLYYVSNER